VPFTVSSVCSFQELPLCAKTYAAPPPPTIAVLRRAAGLVSS